MLCKTIHAMEFLAAIVGLSCCSPSNMRHRIFSLLKASSTTMRVDEKAKLKLFFDRPRERRSRIRHIIQSDNPYPESPMRNYLASGILHYLFGRVTSYVASDCHVRSQAIQRRPRDNPISKTNNTLYEATIHPRCEKVHPHQLSLDRR